ncbi:PorT family protein [Rasiella rasia]|uniref:PorT family protein n=1 Tax=Rasiella rasia TaxID=2744027 RepID=A0A6G6GIZ3_9FLAO|nr:porin family protein [Rasiella rasia]QIE58545.1 PorT family protein [Rasiella rasia]
MKKQVVLVAIALFAFTFTNAQDIKFGAKAGVNFASVGGDFTEDSEGLTGFHIGGLVEILISEKFGIQPEILYSAQGNKFEETTSDIGITAKSTSKQKIDYINIPILGKYYFTEEFSVEAGPQIGFLASANRENDIEVSGENATPEVIAIIESQSGGEQDISDSVKGTDFSLAAGATYRLPMGVFFSARYALGLSNINDGPGSDNFKNQNNVAQLSVGYSF